MAKAYFFDPNRIPPPKPRFTPKGDGKDFDRELFAEFRCQLVPREKWKAFWNLIHAEKLNLNECSK